MNKAKKFAAGALVVITSLLMTTSAFAAVYTNTMTLRQGSMGTAVMSLQECVNSLGFSAGMADGNFGGNTKSAVMAFQASKGLVADGMVGMNTNAKLALACAGTTTPTDDGDTTSDDEPSSVLDFSLNGDEADIQDIDAEDPDNSDYKVGAEDVLLGTVSFDVEEADVLLERGYAVLKFLGPAEAGVDDGDDTQPWKVFDSLSLVVNGETVSEIEADDNDAWDEAEYVNEDDTAPGEALFSYTTNEEDYRVRFANFKNKADAVIEEGDSAEVELRGTFQSGIDLGTDNVSDWAVIFPQDAFRFVDAAALTITMSSSSLTTQFSIEEESADDSAGVSTSTDNPDASIIEVETSSDSNETTVLVADVESDEDGSDLEFQTVYVDVTLTNIAGAAETPTPDDVIDEVTIEFAGETFDMEVMSAIVDVDWDDAMAASGTETITFEFDIDSDVVIDAGDEETMEVMMTFEPLDTAYDAGLQVEANITGTNVGNWDIEGADGDTVTDLDGSASGETHELRVEGIDATIKSMTYNDTVNTSGQVTSVDYFIVLEVEAFGETFYMPEGVSASAGALIGSEYALQNDPAANGSTVSSAILSSSTANTEDDGSGDDFRRINEGDSETFTLKFTVAAEGGAAVGNSRIQLDALYATTDISGVTPTLTTFTLLPSQDFRTDYQSINYTV